METNYVITNNGGIVGGIGNVVNNFGSFQQSELSSLLSEFRTAVEQAEIPEERKQEAKECIETIEEEAAKERPKKSIIKLAFNKLKEVATSDKFLKLLEKLTPVIVALIQ
ncbi:MAG: hypothetical protein K2O45_07000 [Oscillospiraceae bacterium]|nr:hypothetical protein [Oscillospiraceae bacterium]